MQNSQELANRIKQKAKEKNIAIGKMLQDCQLSVNTLSSRKAGGFYPRLEAICKIADYLDVSVDYLLDRPISGLSEEENLILSAYRSKSEEIKAAARGLLGVVITDKEV